MRIFFLAVLAGACTSAGLNVHASVTSAKAQCETEEQAGPAQRIPGSTISLSCPPPQGGPAESHVVGLTDRKGELAMDEVSLVVNDGCEVVVQAPGYRVRRYKIGDVCMTYSGNRCTRARVMAEVVHDLPCN